MDVESFGICSSRNQTSCLKGTKLMKFENAELFGTWCERRRRRTAQSDPRKEFELNKAFIRY